MDSFKLKLLYALVSNLANTINLILELLENPKEEEAKVCPHQNRTDMSTMGGLHWICKDCGFEYEGGE